MLTLWNDIIGWWEHPFKEDGTAVDWLLFFGLLMLIGLFWQFVLLEITAEV